MKKILILLAFLMLTGCASNKTIHNEDEQINVSARQMIKKDDNKVVLEGNVVLREKDIKIYSDRAEIAFRNENQTKLIKSIKCEQGIFEHKTSTNRSLGGGDILIYNKEKETIELIGNVAAESSNRKCNQAPVIYSITKSQFIECGYR